MHINIKNRAHNHSEDLMKPNKIETKNILIDEKKFKDLIIYFTRYINLRSMKMLSRYFCKLIGKIKEHEGKNI